MAKLTVIRKAWLDYCLINPSGKPDEFCSDDWFGETITQLNNEKLRSSDSPMGDTYLRDIVAPNAFSLWKSQEVMASATGATNHGDHHAVVKTHDDVSYVLRELLSEDVFTEKLGRGSGIRDQTRASSDLFRIGTAALASGVPLRQYKTRARGNRAESAWVDDGTGLFEDDLDDVVENFSSEDNDNEDKE